MRRYDIPLLAGLTVLAAMASLHLGLRSYSPATVWAALVSANETPETLIITGLRVPRTCAALIVGAALGVSGMLMQAVFRNPLAEPGLLGVNAGASFAVVTAFTYLGVSSLWVLSLAAFVGSAATMTAIFALIIASRGTLTPISLVLAGVTIAAFVSALTQVMIVTDEGAMEALLFWLAGGFADRDVSVVFVLWPALLLGIVLAGLSAQALDVMATGEATAQALGVDVAKLRILVLGLASLLAAFSVVTAGPVGFVGLIAPHIARFFTGTDHRILLPKVALIGALLAVTADIAARLIVAPQEAPVTAMLALFGAPVLISLVRNKRMRAIG